MAGLPMLKKAKTESSRSLSKQADDIDLSSIYFHGEQEDAVEVYNTCDQVRQMITAYLRKDGVTAASLYRHIYAQLHGSRKNGPCFQSKQLSDLGGYRWAIHGNSSGVFYAAYVFIEKLRAEEGEKKSAHRPEMEKHWSMDFEPRARG